jgi:hypothetical protein
MCITCGVKGKAISSISTRSKGRQAAQVQRKGKQHKFKGKARSTSSKHEWTVVLARMERVSEPSCCTHTRSLHSFSFSFSLSLSLLLSSSLSHTLTHTLFLSFSHSLTYSLALHQCILSPCRPSPSAPLLHTATPLHHYYINNPTAPLHHYYHIQLIATSTTHHYYHPSPLLPPITTTISHIL